MKLGLWLVAVLLPLYLGNEGIDRQHGRSTNKPDAGQSWQAQKADTADDDGRPDQQRDGMVGHT